MGKRKTKVALHVKDLLPFLLRVKQKERLNALPVYATNRNLKEKKSAERKEAESTSGHRKHLIIRLSKFIKTKNSKRIPIDSGITKKVNRFNMTVTCMNCLVY